MVFHHGKLTLFLTKADNLYTKTQLDTSLQKEIFEKM